jgi:dipeptidyl aminopeptidase/acylaminoacyl peptidase
MHESDQIVEKLRSLGKKVEYIVFEDEGHGFTKYSNMIKAYKTAAEFLVKSLDDNA